MFLHMKISLSFTTKQIRVVNAMTFSWPRPKSFPFSSRYVKFSSDTVCVTRYCPKSMLFKPIMEIVRVYGCLNGSALFSEWCPMLSPVGLGYLLDG